jgi:hypothetical protein
MKRRPAALALVALLAWASASQAECPTNYVKWFGHEYYPTTPAYEDLPLVAYNLPAGTIDVAVYANYYSSDQNVVRVSDDYWLEGPASNDPISFSVSMHITGSANSWAMKTPNYCTGGGIFGYLRSGSDEQSRYLSASGCSGELTLDETVSLSLQKLPGEVFNVGMDGYATAFSTTSTMRGVLTFSVPPPYGIRSCQGFHLLPTPAASRSWGSLKAAYR